MTLTRSHSKRLYPVHLAVALAGRLSACPLFFTAKWLHSAAHRLLRSSAPWVPLSAHEQNAVAATIRTHPARLFRLPDAPRAPASEHPADDDDDDGDDLLWVPIA